MSNPTTMPTPAAGTPAWWEDRYQTGSTPWDQGTVAPEVTAFVAAHPGRGRWALDIGCGTGTHSRALARCGYRVVGIDFSFLALHKALQAAAAEHLPWYGLRGSAQDLLMLQQPFAVVLDIGCFHGLNGEQRQRYAEGLAQRLAPGGYYLLYTVRPSAGPETGDMAGADPAQLETLFRGFLKLEDRQEGWHQINERRSDWWWWRR